MRRAQFHFDHELVATLATARGLSPGATRYWGMCVMEAESYEQICEVFADAEFRRVIPADGTVLFDMPQTLAFGGRWVTAFERDEGGGAREA